MPDERSRKVSHSDFRNRIVPIVRLWASRDRSVEIQFRRRRIVSLWVTLHFRAFVHLPQSYRRSGSPRSNQTACGSPGSQVSNSHTSALRAVAPSPEVAATTHARRDWQNLRACRLLDFASTGGSLQKTAMNVESLG